MNDTQLIRQWWYEYSQVLREELTRLGSTSRLKPIADELQARGIIREGYPMPRTGAEDLAADCDQIRRSR